MQSRGHKWWVVAIAAYTAFEAAGLPAGAAAPAPTATPRAFRPGVLLVKFKDDHRVAAADLYQRGAPLAGATGATHLDGLNQRYRVKAIRPLVTLPLGPARTAATAPASAADWNAHVQGVRQRYATRARRASAAGAGPDLSTIFVFDVPPETDIAQLAAEYAADPAVEYAEPDYTYQLHFVPDDPFFSSSGSWGQDFADLWGLHNIGAEAAWDLSTGAGVTVAVLDTGLAGTPENLGNLWINPGEIAGNGIDDDGNGFIDDVAGWSFLTPDGNFFDGDGHGTHVSGTIAAAGNNGNGIIGVAWQSKIMTVQVVGDFGTSTDVVAAGLMYAADNGADVINMSFGGFGTSFVLRDAIDYAAAHGVVMVASAGNDTIDVKAVSPANFDAVIAVSAVDHLDQPSFFSNFGGKIDVAAPGGGDAGPQSIFEPYNSILSLSASNCCGDIEKLTIHQPNDNSQTFLRLAGTSMAAPHVTGVAALVLSRHPEFTAEQVRQVLRDGAQDLGPSGTDARYGYGRLNAAAAVGRDQVAVARLHAPTKFGHVRGEPIAAEGTVQNPGGATPSWRVLFGPQGGTLSEIASGAGAVDHGALATVDTGPLARGNYTLRLEVTAADGATASDTAVFTRLAARPYLRQVSTATPHFVVLPYAVRPNAWSGDGQTLVWSEAVGINYWRVVAHDMPTESDRVVAEYRLGPELLEAQEPPDAVISDDGNTIVFAAPADLSTSTWQTRPAEVFLFDVPSGELTQLTHAGGYSPLSYRGICINTDGSRVAFASDSDLDPTVGNADRNYELFYWDRGSNLFHQVTNNATSLVGAALGSPAMSIDGNSIAFMSFDDLDPGVGNPLHQLQVFVYDVGAAQVRQLTQANAGHPMDTPIALSTDGSKIAAWRLNPTGPSRTLVLIDATGGSSVDLLTVPQTTSTLGLEVFSRDGERIYFPADTSFDRLFPPPPPLATFLPRELFEYDLATAQTRRLTGFAAAYLRGLAAGPDGRLAFTKDASPHSGDPEASNDDQSTHVYLLDPSLSGGYLAVKRERISRGAGGRDRFAVSGYLLVTGAPIDPAASAVAVTLLGANGQLFRAAFPAGAMRGGSGSWHLAAPGAPLRTFTVHAIDAQHYRFGASGRLPGLFDATTPYVAVQVDIGAASFGDSVRLRGRGRTLRYP